MGCKLVFDSSYEGIGSKINSLYHPRYNIIFKRHLGGWLKVKRRGVGGKQGFREIWLSSDYRGQHLTLIVNQY